MNNRTILLALLLLIASAHVYGQSTAQSSKPDAYTERELRALRRDLMEALRLGDRAVLERILADGFTFVHSTGALEARKEFINRAVANARTSPAPEGEFTDERVSVYEGRTVIWATRSVGRNRSSGAENIFRATDVLVKVGGRWQWASVHCTSLPSRPKAVAIGRSIYVAYLGQYEIAPGRVLTVAEDGGVLKGAMPGFRPAELIPKSEAEFVWFNPDSNVRAQVVFIRDEGGRVTHAALRRDGEEVWRAKKVK